MGTAFQKRGLPPGVPPETMNFTDPETVKEIHRSYIDAGSRVIYANTFGANDLKLAGSGYTAEQAVAEGVRLAKESAAGTGTLAALDVGPLGELLEPLGTLTFEEALQYFKTIMKAGAAAGADLIVIETMTDLYEAKAALLAARENTDLPAAVTMSVEESGRTFTGCTIPSMARTLEGLGADAVGLNCSVGPDLMAPLLSELAENTTLPVIAKPNAGLPDPVDGTYHMGPEEFAAALAPCLDAGVTIFGGCCGTGPEYISALVRALDGKKPGQRNYKKTSFVCTPTRPVALDGVHVIGERINPTGKKRLRQALAEKDLDYVLQLGMEQEDAGAEILDVNVGCPGVDEAEMLPLVVKKLQSVLSVPLQLDSADPEALEAGLRVYNGKPAVNSVNGDPQVLERLLPVVHKYGASVVGLTMTGTGMPADARERVETAGKILAAAQEQGIPREDVWIDCLTLTASAQPEQAAETLEAVRIVRHELGLQTVLGVSNISFGLPDRTLITRTFLVQALEAGLTLPILNPNQREIMDTLAAYRVLSGKDEQCRAYVDRFSQKEDAPAADSAEPALTLEEAVARGMEAEAARLAKLDLESEDELQLVENRLIPALDGVGKEYEEGRAFLPQLLAAAQAAQAVFGVVRDAAARRGGSPVKKGRLAVATVRGDIHDIGKNIVRTVLENYGYEVLDLGRDVPPETILDKVREEDIRLVGLSALMTTTLPAMAETVRLLKTLPDPPAVFVGGAVVTPEYAAEAGADYYAKDARESVEITKKVLGG
ncbi:MAG: homocysteine S-methyltransferase family protein [Oscillospiraceae bacterium]|nr:homocysteine S-methyltransferase family protein [Oscillospiraceae bacterium]